MVLVRYLLCLTIITQIPVQGKFSKIKKKNVQNNKHHQIITQLGVRFNSRRNL